MVETVLCYIKLNNKYLMLYRNKKINDPNAGKWMGVGGHIEQDENPDEAMIREIKEETNLTVKKYQLRGVATFINDSYQEKMYLYSVFDVDGEIGDCNEGELKFFTEEEIYGLNMWEGDKYFLPLMFSNEPYFEITLYYKNDVFIKMERTK